MNSGVIAGIILSAGASRRMGTPKALLDVHGETFLDRLLLAFAPACRPLIVVLGHDAERIRQGINPRTPIELVLNPDPARGMLSSLQCGLRAIPAEAQAVLFTPVDYPAILPATIASLARIFEERRAPVTRPRYQGRRGHPVCISRGVIDELLTLPVTAQARDVVRAYRPQAEYVDVDDPGILDDIDLPEDYQRLTAQAVSAQP
jgi:molybdenum cofactor cytidylyltransferase